MRSCFRFLHPFWGARPCPVISLILLCMPAVFMSLSFSISVHFPFSNSSFAWLHSYLIVCLIVYIQCLFLSLFSVSFSSAWKFNLLSISFFSLSLHGSIAFAEVTKVSLKMFHFTEFWSRSPTRLFCKIIDSFLVNCSK